MAIFKLEVDLSGDTFTSMDGEAFDSTALEDILRGVLEILEADGWTDATAEGGLSFHDFNGHRIGHWAIEGAV